MNMTTAEISIQQDDLLTILQRLLKKKDYFIWILLEQWLS